MSWQNYTKEGPGFDKSKYPKNRFAMFFMLFIESFWRLMALNLFFILFSLPVITIPAAITALNSVCVKLSMDKPVFVWSDFYSSFKKNFWRSELMGIAFAVLYAVALLAIYYYLNMQAAFALATIALVLTIICIYIFYLVTVYVFIMLPIIDLPITKLIKNAFIFALAAKLKNLITVIVFVGVIVAVIETLPAGLILVLLLGFSLISFTACFNSIDVIKENVILPHYKGSTLPEDFI